MFNEMGHHAIDHNRAARTFIILALMMRSVGGMKMDSRARRMKTASDFALSIATGNIGGGQPQPEFLGSDWETRFGEFEKLIGAMALTTRDGKCASQGWDAKYARYAGAGFGCNEDGGLSLVEGDKPPFKLPMKVSEVLGNEKALIEILDELEREEPSAEAAETDEEKEKKEAAAKREKEFVKFLDTDLQEVFTAELKDGKGFSGPEACLKNRMAFPYFEAGLLGLSDKFKDPEFMKIYLRDLRGKERDLTDNKDAGLPTAKLEKNENTAREFATTTMCKTKDRRSDILSFRTDQKWWYLALWDVYVVKAFSEWYSQRDSKPEKMEYMDGTKKDGLIGTIAKHFVGTVDIFFTQETPESICTGLGTDATRAACRPFKKPAKGEKPEEDVYDAAVFLKEGMGMIQEDNSADVRKIYEELLKKVDATAKASLYGGEGSLEDKMGQAKKAKKLKEMEDYKGQYIEAAKKLKQAGAEGDGKLVADALAYVLQPINIGTKMIESAQFPKVELAVATLRKEKHKAPVLLVSAHPDSDGKYCAFILFLAKRVFELKRKELGLKYLIVGMDTNVQTDEDFKAKMESAENGYNFDEFRKVVEGSSTATIALDDKGETTAVVQQLGYTAMWPTDEQTFSDYRPTVHKQRTFLQAQLHKAAKYDRVVKDVVFLYEAPEDRTVLRRVKGAAHTVRRRICRTIRAMARAVFPRKEGSAAGISGGDVEVVNTYNLETKEESFRDEKFPKEDWPMDHSVSKASVSLGMDPVPAAKK